MFIKSDKKFALIVNNSSWLFFDKILRIGVGFVISAMCARYLGTKLYGQWNYLIAFTSLFSVISSLGLDGVIVRDLVKSPDKANEIIGSAFIIKLFGGITAFVLPIIFIFFLKNNDKHYVLLVTVLSSAFIFQSLNVISLYFQSTIRSKYVVMCQGISFICSSILKVILVFNNANLLEFILVSVFEVCMSSVLLATIYNLRINKLIHWRPNVRIIKEMLKISWPLIFASLANMIYMRIDQVMIGQMKSENEVGLYSAAVRLCESWYFIIGIIEISFFPTIIKAKEISEQKYYHNIKMLICACLVLSLIFILFINVFSTNIISIVFGSNYADAAMVLRILSWTGIIISFGGIWGQWIILENMQRWSMYTVVLSMAINVLLNLFLIPKFGANGAAFATSISNILALILLGTVNTKIRKMNFLLITSIFEFKNIIKDKRLYNFKM